MSDKVLTGEVSNSKVVAVFATHRAAREAADALVAHSDLEPAQVKVIDPDTADVGIQIEPEGEGIWRTIVLAHSRMAIAGGVLGLVAFAALMVKGVPFITQSPWAAALVMLSFGVLAGLLLGGLVSLRPDHDRFVHAARDASDEGRSSVVVHALSQEQQRTAAELLGARGGEVTTTL